MRAAIYVRISTFKRLDTPQATPEESAPVRKKGQDPLLQLRVLRETAERRGWDVVMEESDEISGSKARRPGRDAILAAARRKKIDVVMVWKLDRWGRSMADLAATLNELREIGVGFYSETEALDFTTPTGRAMAGLLAVFAEFERDLIRERVKAGVENARAKGKRLGRKPLDRSIVEAIVQDLEASVPWSQIVTKHHVSKMTVARISRGWMKGRAELVNEAGGPKAFAVAMAKRILADWNLHREAGRVD